MILGAFLLLSIVARVAALTVGDGPELHAALSAASCVLVLLFAVRSRAALLPSLRLPPATSWLWLIVFAVVALPLLEACFWLMRRLGFPFIEYLPPYLAQRWPLWVPFLLIAVLTPISEEIAFRGIVQQKLERVLGQREAWIVQAALFSAAHLSALILLTHFAMGLLLGWLMGKSRSIYPGVLLHAAWNGWVLWRELP